MINAHTEQQKKKIQLKSSALGLFIADIFMCFKYKMFARVSVNTMFMMRM